ncbi:MAG: Cell shape-determining protein RodA [candidate division TM6 bacterium GW2011_GWF2_30_66]|jgi:rod shape determining protein RodA|nr:MAG: Cell shape-determining protein RodA [candidate division TM6 bacterium GW2011_GWF2_30_66]
MFSVKNFRKFDWTTLFLIIGIALFGLLFIFSATYKPDVTFSTYFKKQLLGIISGIFLYAFFSMIDHRQLMRFGYFLYFLIMGLLAFTIVKGSVAMGGQRWVNLVFIKFQPSEMAKLLFPAFVAYFLSTQRDDFDFKFKDFLPTLIVLAISFLLILKQPDLGTALIILFSGAIILWIAGIGKKFFIVIAAISIIMAPIGWKVLKDYQKKRILVFIGQGESRKERYQIEQSQIAIGSGGLFGKGFLQGTQNKLSFLPESRTDFIFSVVCEELGFLGALILISLYILLFIRLFMILVRIDSPFIKIFALGIVLHVFLSVIINMFMVTGLLPIVGIPLPLFSYGLSNLWTIFISFGWINSIKMQTSR